MRAVDRVQGVHSSWHQSQGWQLWWSPHVHAEGRVGWPDAKADGFGSQCSEAPPFTLSWKPGARRRWHACKHWVRNLKLTLFSIVGCMTESKAGTNPSTFLRPAAKLSRRLLVKPRSCGRESSQQNLLTACSTHPGDKVK